MKSCKCRILAGICMVILVMCCCLPLTANAQDGLGTLVLWCARDEEIVDGMHRKIYRVGHRSENDYVFEGDFSGYRPTLGDHTKSMLEWDAGTVASAAETLRVYAILDKLPFRSEGVTDENGRLSFTGLEDGLYLVVGDTLKKGTITYIPGAIFVVGQIRARVACQGEGDPEELLRCLHEQPHAVCDRQHQR